MKHEGFNKRRPKPEREIKRPPGMLTGKQMLQAGAMGLSLVAGTVAYEKAKESYTENKSAVYEAVRDDKRLALPMFALLARGYLAKPIDLLADPSLRHIRSIDPAAVVPLTTHSADASFITAYEKERAIHDANPLSHTVPTEKEWARNKKQTLNDQKKVFNETISKYKRDPIQLGQSVAMVSRNISWNQYPINYTFGREDHGSNVTVDPRLVLKPQQVTAEVSTVLNERRRLQNSDPLAQSDVVLLSNNEMTDAAHKRFGNAALVDHLRYVVQTSSRTDAPSAKKHDLPKITGLRKPYEFINITTGAQASDKELAAAKQNALRSIENGSRKTSFLFDGHGSEIGLYLSNGQANGSTYVAGEFISVDEMAQSLSRRWFSQKRTDPKATNLNISIMLGSCTSQNFIRSLAAKLEALGVPQPQIMVSSSEYGQFGFTNVTNKYNSRFWTWVIQNETVGSMISNKGDVKDATPAIFTPRPERPTKLMQLGGVVLPNPDSQSA